MNASTYQPLFTLTRQEACEMQPAENGRTQAPARRETVESVHYGAFTVVDACGRLVAHVGDSQALSFLRSSAKPFQLMPFLEAGGQQAYDLTAEEIAVMCASHSGTDRHVAVIQEIQRRAGLSEADLRCGSHPPLDTDTAESLLKQGQPPTPIRHNCSGKHTGMLAFARLQGLPLENYLQPEHPVQERILQTFAEMCDLPVEGVARGTDGCSAPNFAVPLYHAALAFARLCDPEAGEVESGLRAGVCRTITAAMAAHGYMVAGPGRFDTRLMEVGKGRFVAKGGAEGYQCVGLMPGVLGRGSPGLGIAIKIADGDPKSRARPAVVLHILDRLGALTDEDRDQLAEFGPEQPVYNWRRLLVGWGRPCFEI